MKALNWKGENDCIIYSTMIHQIYLQEFSPGDILSEKPHLVQSFKLAPTKG